MQQEAIRLVREQIGNKAAQLFENLLAQKPAPADAIVFLQGDRLDRVPKVLELFQAGFAPVIVLTGNNAVMERRQANNENDMYLSELIDHFKKAGVPNEVIVIDDQAMHTKDQAVSVVTLAKKRGWQKLILVTSPYHLLRAYLTFLKQIKEQGWQGKIVMQSIDQDWSAIPTGRSKTTLQMLEEELEKVQRYEKDIASPESGLKFLKFTRLTQQG